MAVKNKTECLEMYIENQYRIIYIYHRIGECDVYTIKVEILDLYT